MSIFALVTAPKLDRAQPAAPEDEGLLLKLALRVVGWIGEQIRYHRALRELHQLTDRDLDDINSARADFPELARWHAATAA